MAKEASAAAIRAAERAIGEAQRLVEKAQGKQYTEGLISDSLKLVKALKTKKTKLSKLEQKSNHMGPSLQGY